MPRNFWKVQMLSNGKAEVLLYGEILRRRPVDFWTGEPLNGLFITPEGFLEDLEQIRNASEITIRVNSPGGDVATGQAIYTQLNMLSGRRIGIVDSLAASAATLPLMACHEIRIPAGGRIMIHECELAPEPYQSFSADELRQMAEAGETINEAAAETYHAKTGLPSEDIRAKMKAVTWMTGRQAVEIGFADKILFEEEDSAPVQMSSDGKFLFAGNQKYSVQMLANIPEDIPVKEGFFTPFMRSAARRPDHIIQQTTAPGITPAAEPAGGEAMYKTPEELMKAFPDVCVEICKTAKAEGVQEERMRLQAIEEIAKGIGDEKMVFDAKFGKQPVSAQDLAMAAMKKQSALGANFMTKLKVDASTSGVAAVSAAPNDGATLSEDEERMALAQAIAKNTNGGNA